MKFAKKTDLLILAILLVLCAGSWLIYRYAVGGKAAKAEIYYKSHLVETISLTKGQERTFSIPENEHVIFHLYADGTIRFEESDCPDKVCIRAGRLQTIGESAACLPNDIILKIVSGSGHSSDDIDLIAS